MSQFQSESTIKEETILNVAWLYFQQHANQRIGYFNFFVIFSSLLTTGLLTTFQDNFRIHYLGIIIGLLQMICSFAFWKIDDRNKALTKNGENVIKNIEHNYYINNDVSYSNKLRLFTNEEIETNKLKKMNKNIILKQISHSKSFNIIFITFFIIGFFGSFLSLYYHFNNVRDNNKLIIIDSDISKINSKIYIIENEIAELNNEANIKNALENIEQRINDLQKEIDNIMAEIKTNYIFGDG